MAKKSVMKEVTQEDIADWKDGDVFEIKITRYIKNGPFEFRPNQTNIRVKGSVAKLISEVISHGRKI